MGDDFRILLCALGIGSGPDCLICFSLYEAITWTRTSQRPEDSCTMEQAGSSKANPKTLPLHAHASRYWLNILNNVYSLKLSPSWFQRVAEINEPQVIRKCSILLCLGTETVSRVLSSQCEFIGASGMRRTWLSRSQGSVERLLLLRMGKRQSGSLSVGFQGRRNMAGDMVHFTHLCHTTYRWNLLNCSRLVLQLLGVMLLMQRLGDD